MKPRRNINLCQPGYGASCSLCCGSHNFRTTKARLKKIFKKRTRIYNSVMGPDGGPGPVLDGIARRLIKISAPRKIQRGIQCAYIGQTGAVSKTIGCLAYSDMEQLNRAAQEFFKNTCKTFYCAGWDILSDDEVLFAARLMQDWFYYSLLIADIALLKKFFNEYREPERVPGESTLELKGILRDKLKELIVI